MNLFYLIVGLACGFVFAVGLKSKRTPEAEGTPEAEKGSDEQEQHRFPDVEYEVESEEP